MPIRLTAAALRRIQGAPARAARPRTPPALAAPSSAVRLEVVVPLRLVSSANSRPAHWAVRHRRVKAERAAVRAALVCSFEACPVVLFLRRPVRVTITRLGGRGLDRHENLPMACKACVDEVCAWLHRDDADPSVSFCYDQQPGGAHGVRLTIETGTGGGA